MASITIRNLSDQTKATLRVRAAEQGLSLEAYIRNLLQRTALQEAPEPVKLTDLARKYFGPRGGVDLELPSRRSHRKAPDFDQ